MNKSSSRRFPVTITKLPLTRCQICDRTVAYWPGSLSEALTEHYRRTHPERSDFLPSSLAGPLGGLLPSAPVALRERDGRAPAVTERVRLSRRERAHCRRSGRCDDDCPG